MSEKAAEYMPSIDTPKMVEIKFAVPAELLRDALDLAKTEGWKPAEIHRMFWEKGFAVHAEGSNKRLINRKLRNEQPAEVVDQPSTAGDMKEFLTQLAAGYLPTNGHLVTLAHDLGVETEVLMELRDRVRSGNGSKKEQAHGT